MKSKIVNRKLSIVNLFRIVIILLSGSAMAQQDPMYTQYMFNMLPINPAFAGSRDVISMTALYRNMWYGVDGAPKTLTFSADMPILKEKIGLGAVVNKDVIGKFDNTRLMAMASYRLRLSRGTLAFGMNFGVQNAVQNLGNNNLPNQNDTKFQNTSLWLPIVGSGIYYTTDRFYAGLSFPQMITITFDPNSASKDMASRQTQHMNLMAGYVIPLSPDYVLKPSVLWKTALGVPNQLDINCNFWMYNILGLGVSYRSLDAVSGLIEWQANEQIRFGFAYDWPHTAINKYTFGSIEFMVRYEMGYNKSKVLSPRYF
ncbi:MAG: type IX secretion system membrane protein PorP/SprF [Bacteroidota bacterium]|nr:type IX secretion system membrane protein PorP/SprF [Bacteroidota bacterium]